MKFLTIFALHLGLMAATPSYASTICFKGSKAHELVASIDNLLPNNMTTVLIRDDDRSILFNEIDPALLPDAEVPIAKLKQLQKAPWSIGLKTAVAYAQVIDLSSHEAGPSLCVIRFKNADWIKESLMHEAMHCRTTHQPTWNRFASHAKALVNAELISSNGDRIPKKIKQYVIEEVRTQVMSYAIMKKTGHRGDLAFFETRIHKPFPSNPGEHSLHHALTGCRAKACSTDAANLMASLAKDNGFKKEIVKDMDIAYLHHLKMGTTALLE